MKLIGSSIEETYRAELKKSIHALFFELSNRRLRDSIARSFPRMQTAYVLDWVPDQGVDIYEVLIDGELVAEFELLRSTDELADAKDTKSVKDYRARLRKHDELKLIVALDLVAQGYSPGSL